MTKPVTPRARRKKPFAGINPHPHSLREHLLFALHGPNPLRALASAPPELRGRLSAMVRQALEARVASKQAVLVYRREMRERQTSLLEDLEATLR